jgi:hypothetical protein
MTRLLRDGALRAQLQRAALERAQRLSWAATALQTEEVYRAAIAAWRP